MAGDERDLVLWLANNLTEDGQELGTKSLIRLVAAWSYARKTGATIVVAAAKSKDFPTQPMTMAEMAAKQLADWGHDKVIVLEADEFNTAGELRAFMSVKTAGRRTVVSAEWHLSRARATYIQLYGKRAASSIRWEPAQLDTLDSFRGHALEAIKWLYIYLPKWLQALAVRCYRLLFGNPSWVK